MITLHDYWRSSASYRVRIALEMMDGPWRSLSVDLKAGEQTSAAHLARNPQGLVPALEIDGQRLTQSLAIVEYLDATRGLGLIPDDPFQAAKVRSFSYAIAMDIHPVCNLRVARAVAEASGGAVPPDDWMRQIMTPGLAALESMVDGGPCCFGSAPTMADLCLVPQMYNATRKDVDLAPLPRLRAITAHLETLPAFAAAHPDRFQSADTH